MILQSEKGKKVENTHFLYLFGVKKGASLKYILLLLVYAISMVREFFSSFLIDTESFWRREMKAKVILSMGVSSYFFPTDFWAQYTFIIRTSFYKFSEEAENWLDQM